MKKQLSWAAQLSTIVLMIAPAAGEASAQVANSVPELTQCAFVDPPTVIDGSIAEPRAMRTLDAKIREYVTAMQASLACLDRYQEGQLTELQRLTIDQIYDNGVDQLNFIVDAYNRQVRLFQMEDRLPDLIDTRDNN